MKAQGPWSSKFAAFLLESDLTPDIARRVDQPLSAHRGQHSLVDEVVYPINKVL
jgi:hypothetical protein